MKILKKFIQRFSYFIDWEQYYLLLGVAKEFDYMRNKYHYYIRLQILFLAIYINLS